MCACVLPGPLLGGAGDGFDVMIVRDFSTGSLKMESKMCWLSRSVAIGLLSVGVVFAEAIPGLGNDRFVWVFGWNLRRDQDVVDIRSVLETASKNGFNGAVLSAGLDSLCRKDSAYFRRLEEIRLASQHFGLELIPSVFSVGYGGGALQHNRNLAEGIPVVDAPFRVRGNEAHFVADSSIRIRNGGFEEFRENRFQSFNFHDQPGSVSFVDSETKHSGNSAIRFENFGQDEHGHARVMQEVKVRPNSCYRISIWVKSEALLPARAFRLQVLCEGRNIAPRSFELSSTSDWREFTMLFNSLKFASVRIYAGLWQGKRGRLWLDDWRIEEVGPVTVLQRPGTPVTVKDASGTVTFVENNDYAPLEDSGVSLFQKPQAEATLNVIPGGRIRDGDILKVSWYHPMVINKSQVSLCMAEPELYAIWDHEAELLAKHLQPRRILLNMDEIRMGGTCGACQGKNMAHLLGECITRQSEILRRYSRDAKIYIWSDMLDPNHNARSNYYLVRGDYTGSWERVSKDLVIAVWGGSPREKSLRFFSTEGFETLVACYYDADDLRGVTGWIEIASGLSGVQGFMYTTWQRKYSFLPSFGALVGGNR